VVRARPGGDSMTERTDLVVLKYVNKTPSLASCARCQRKFFTPDSYYTDPFGAEEYLRCKFDLHACLGKQRKDGKGTIAGY
jgi:hypothetical protein